MNIRLNILAGLCFWLGLSLNAMAKDAVGLAWHYQSGTKEGYLLGSVHFADSSFYPLSNSIVKAFDKAKELVVEVDDSLVSAEEQQQLLQRYGLYPEGQTLSTHLSATTLDKIVKLLAEFDLTLSAVSNYRPGMLAITLTALQARKLGYSAEQGLDRYFMQKARYRKRITQIETFEAQMALLAALPEDDALLGASFENMADYAEQWTATMNAWKAGDGKALYDSTIGAALEEHPSLQPYFDVLFFNRHQKMLQVAEDCAEQERQCFIVIGAGHLVGPKGLVSALAEQGYQLTQLK